MLVLAWVASLTWLVLREYSPAPGGDNASPAQVRLSPTTGFFGLWAGPTQVGLTSVTTDTLPDGIRVTSRVDLDIPLPLVPRRLLGTTEATYDQRLRLRGYTLSISGEAGQVAVSATALSDSLLSVIVSGRGLTAADTVKIPVPAGVLLPDAVALWLASRDGLQTGATSTVQVFDPLDLSVTARRIMVGAESTFVMPDSAVVDSIAGGWIPVGRDSIRAVSVTWTEGGMPVRAWIDRRGTILAQATPLGLTQRKAPFEIVSSGYTRRRPTSFQASPLELTTPVATPPAPRRLSLGPVDLGSATPMLSTRWQGVVEGTLEARPDPGLVGRGGGVVPDSIPAGDRAMPASPRIIAEARRVAGRDTADPVRAVAKIAKWIGGTIEPGQPVLTGPEHALLRRRGDSSDRAELLVAMVRALGIPARPVAGLLSSGGRLRYRAWAEVWLDGWVPVDPTLGQMPADAGHYRLLTHATARPYTLAPMVGAIRPAFTNPTTAP